MQDIASAGRGQGVNPISTRTCRLPAESWPASRSAPGGGWSLMAAARGRRPSRNPLSAPRSGIFLPPKRSRRSPGWRPAGSGAPAPKPLLRLDAGEPDHLGPFLGLGGDERGEVGGRAGERRAAQFGETRLDPGVGEPRIDLLVEPVDD